MLFLFQASNEIIPFGEDYVIPSESDEEDPSVASTEQMDEKESAEFTKLENEFEQKYEID